MKEGCHMSLHNNYDGMIESWKVTMIKYYAMRHGVTGSDLDDVLQDIVLYLYTEFKYDPARASERTATARVINNRLKMYLRSRRRYLQMLVNRTEPEKTETPHSQIQMSLDIRELYPHMSLEERDTCVLLAEGHSANQIAAMRHCHPSKIQRIIKRIRQLFQERGMQAWLSV